VSNTVCYFQLACTHQHSYQTPWNWVMSQSSWTVSRSFHLSRNCSWI